MPNIGDSFKYTDPHGNVHDAIVGEMHGGDPNRVSGIYIDKDKATAGVFGSGHWLECVVRVIDVDITPAPVVEPDVIALLEQAGPAPAEHEGNDPGDESK